MRVLFDQWTTAYELGWSALTNGELLAKAQQAGFDVLVTTDSNLRHHQNLTTFRLGIVVLGTTSWPRIRRATESILKAVTDSTPGSYVEIDMPS